MKKNRFFKIAAATLFLCFSVANSASCVNLTKVFSLDGTWGLTGYSPDKSRHVTLEGTVPGQVHPDLQRAGLIPDPFWRDNADQCQWPEHWEWRYKKNFDLPVDFPTKRVKLQFDGLDTYAEIYLNGRLVGKTEDMFLPYEFDISNSWLRLSNNVLEVRFKPIESLVGEESREKPFSAAFGDNMRSYVRRMQCTFGWDWVHRFVTAGIWKSCRIVSYDDARIDHIFVYTKSIKEHQAELKLELGTTIFENSNIMSKFLITDPKGKVVWTRSERITSPVMKFDVTISDPLLWWPNGAGEQALYQITTVLTDTLGRELNRYTTETGIRTVSIEELPDADNQGKSFTLIVNGKKIFVKGGNWVPADPFPSRITGQKYNLLIAQARDAGMNMLRSWGGGIYEADAYWHACNRMGIMVSQDFLLACAEYPENDTKFKLLLKQEFEANIKRLRNNPSLVFWCGDNELGLNSKPDDNWSCKNLHQIMTAPLVANLDPSRVFRLTSPFGDDLKTNNSPRYGDSHISGFFNDEIREGDLHDYRKIISKYCSGRFMSENAAAGSPPKRSLLKFMDEQDLKGSEMYEYHTKDNPYTSGGLTLFRSLERCATLLYGDPENNNDRRISQLEYTQYDFVRLAMEGSRRLKFYTSGIQFWMYNDCWPASGWSLIDYWGNRKAAWFAMASGARPVIAASEMTEKLIKWWICNDLSSDANVNVEVKVQPLAGKAKWVKQIKINVPANSSMVAMELPLDEMKEKLGDNAVLVCEISYDKGFDRSYWTAGLPKDTKYPKTTLKISQKRESNKGEITIKSDKWARVITLSADADLDFEDNYFELLPGETRVINWKSRDCPFSGQISVTCWNQ